MSSQINEIYAALKAMNVAIGGTTVPAYAPHELPQAVHTAIAPLRLIVSMSMNGAGQEIVTRGVGAGKQRMLWVMTDLMLLAPAGRTTIATVVPQMREYQVNYLSALNTLKHDLATHPIESATMTPGIHEYSQEDWWFGVAVELRVRETIYYT